MRSRPWAAQTSRIVAEFAPMSTKSNRKSFAMVMLAKVTVPYDELKRRLNAKGEQIVLEIDAQDEGVFKFTHRV